MTWKERQRARRELAAVEQSGFGPYFLVVHDIVEFARRRGILHNLRGSGASSFLGWLLGLSHVNPIEFDLYFERFLNRGRPDPPDIDIDFDSAAPRRGPALRPRALRRGQDRRGLRLRAEGLRRPLGPLRDAPGLRRAARRGPRPVQARAVLRRAVLAAAGRPGPGPPRRLEARRRAPGRLSARSPSTSAASS
ncbi:MAG: hypothetical protein M0C28_35470 [Candidatus Moduliflexus flocculans]|nr:hypothetical protein [Candidatus Moduliflexus flocculans]